MFLRVDSVILAIKFGPETEGEEALPEPMMPITLKGNSLCADKLTAVDQVTKETGSMD